MDETPISESLKERELKLAESRLRTELALKERELALSEQRLQREADRSAKEFELKGREINAGRWSGPVAVAVVAGSLGILGTLFSARENRELERKKQEGTLVLEAIRTGGSGKEREQQAAANLVFFADARLVTLEKSQLDELRKRAGNASPALPTATSTVPQPIPEAIRQRILKSFDEFSVYFRGAGAKVTPKVSVETTPPGSPSMIAYYDLAKATVYIDAQYLADVNLPLREYAHAVLYADGKSSLIDYDRTWAYVAIESGLASYFASSFVKSPRIPGGDEKETLENNRKANELRPGTNIVVDGIYVWGGAFWELRKELGPGVADRILYSAWQSMTQEELRRNTPRDFVNGILKADARLERGRNQSLIGEIFKRRGFDH